MTKTLDTKWKKSIIQIARELKKANQLTAVIGNGMLKSRLENLNEKKTKLKKIVETEGLSYVR